MLLDELKVDDESEAAKDEPVAPWSGASAARAADSNERVEFAG